MPRKCRKIATNFLAYGAGTVNVYWHSRSGELAGFVTNNHSWETSVFLVKNALLKFVASATPPSIKIAGRGQETP